MIDRAKKRAADRKRYNSKPEVKAAKRAYMKKYYSDKGREKAKAWWREHGRSWIARKRKDPKSRARFMLSAAKQTARLKGYDFNLTIEDISIPKVCPVYGVPFDFESLRGDFTPSVDRKNSSLGYIKGNVHIISWRANRLKSSASIDDLERLLAYMKLK